MKLDAASLYHAKHRPQALLVIARRSVVLERYDDGFHADMPHPLFSGTKSFWGIAALVAARERLLDLDTPVWGGASIRQLLTLTAGVPFGGLGSAVPPFEQALQTRQIALPGERFTYGGIPAQIFGAVFSRALEPLALTPHEYLRKRILEPAGVAIASWRTLKDGTHPLPTGAFLTARNWANYGAYVRDRRGEFAECFAGTPANPRYGMGWWLAPPKTPENLFYASGSGGQALYVVPSHELVAVRYGGGGSFNHQTFLHRLLSA